MNYSEIKIQLQKIADVNIANAVLSWDKEVNLPEGGAALRARQMATLSSISHEMFTDKKLFESIEKCLDSDSLSGDERINLKRVQRDIRNQTKFSTEFVEKLSIAVSTAYQAWMKAKKANDFSLYKSALQDVIVLKKESAEILGYENHPYEALVDQYEPEMKVETLDKTFQDVKDKLIPRIQKLMKGSHPDDGFVKQYYNKNDQWEFGLQVLKGIGYNFKCGRQDQSPHPFSISFGPEDVRVTTRIDDHNFAYMLWSTIHEGGHALYEQGLDSSEYGMPLGQAASLSIHESQSRLWENHVGRSAAFWKYYLPKLKTVFPKQLDDISFDHFYGAINKLQPNFIRTEADELHYHLHVLIRYEIEKKIISENINPTELPELWNSLYREYLNIEVKNDNDGILQDVHWAFGSIGYFPTYSLGSFYAAQFYNSIEKMVPGLEEMIEKGNTKPILIWLKDNVFSHGRRHTAEKLCELITGEPLNLNYFLEYVDKKYSAIYNV